MTILLFVLTVLTGFSDFGYAVEAPASMAESILVTLSAEKKDAYINELIPVTVTVRVEGVAVRDVQYPKVSGAGLVIGDFGHPSELTDSAEGRTVTTYVFQTKAYGAKPGNMRIDPAEVSVTVFEQAARNPAEELFGGREARVVTLRSGPADIRIKPLPQKDRPQGFEGAVGKYEFTARSHPVDVLPGDPVTITMTIKGEGRLEGVACPGVGAAEGLKVRDVSRRQGLNEITCEQVVTPESAEVTQIAAVVFSYFDPAAGTYKSIRRGPFPVRVLAEEPSPSGKSDASAPSPVIPEAPRAPVPNLPHAAMLVVLLFAVIGAAVFIVLRRRRKSPDSPGEADIPPVITAPRSTGIIKEGACNAILDRTRAALDTGDQNAFYDAVFRSLQEMLGAALDIPPAGITFDAVSGAAHDLGLDHEAETKITRLFHSCDDVRYGNTRRSRSDMQSDYALLQDIADVFLSASQERR